MSILVFFGVIAHPLGFLAIGLYVCSRAVGVLSAPCNANGV